jgi:hypothetical protein
MEAAPLLTRAGLGLTSKYLTRLERLTKRKHSSLISLFANDEELKKVFLTLTHVVNV